MSLKAPDATRQALGVALPDERPYEALIASACATMGPLDMAVSAGIIASGVIIAGRARNGRKQTYTKIRIYTGTTTPVSLTDVRLGVWDAAGAVLLASTANESAAVVAANTMYTLNLTAALTLLTGQDVYLGGGSLGTTPFVFRGVAFPASAFVSRTGVLGPHARLATGWAGGALPAAIASNSGAMPWAELVA